MRERTIYECEHCNKKRLLTKGSMKNHEAKCWYNPETKSCLTCWYQGYYDGTNNTCWRNSDYWDAEIIGRRPATNCPHYKNYDEEIEKQAEVKL